MLRTTLCIAAVLGFIVEASAQDRTTGLVDAAVIMAPEEGGPRRWRVTAADGLSLQRAPASGSPAIATVADGEILSNFGCLVAEGRPWCSVQPLGRRVRGYVAAESLRPVRGPDGTVAMGEDDSARRAGRGDFDATGRIACAQNPGQPLGECTVAVARGDGGDATVVVTFSNGFKRRLFFAHGRFISGDTTMSGTGFDSDWRREGDLFFIRVDDQRFELPAALPFGW